MSDSTAGEPARINQPTKEGRGYTPGAPVVIIWQR